MSHSQSAFSPLLRCETHPRRPGLRSTCSARAFLAEVNDLQTKGFYDDAIAFMPDDPEAFMASEYW